MKIISKKIKEKLLKFKNIEIIYATEKQYWGITLLGVKKRIGLEIFNIFLKNKYLISYKDSTLLNKNNKFIILRNKIEVYIHGKIKIMNFLKKEIQNINIFKMDGLNFLQKEVVNNSVDLILTDPPYMISKNTSFNKLFVNKKNLTENIEKKYAFSTVFEWDNEFNIDLLELYIEQYFLKLKIGGTLIIFFDLWKIAILKDLLVKYNFKQIRFIEWIKSNPVPLNSKINYLSNAREIALVAVKGSHPTFNSVYDNGIYTYPIEQKNRTHPNQKNLKLILNLIQKHSNENDLVLDSFLGSGTTAVACKKLKRQFIGCELKDEYFQHIQKRLINEK